MAGPGLATRDDLLNWPSIVAAGEFPRLIRRLIWETVPDVVRLGFPAGSGTSAGSWDGSVRTIAGNTYVPAGLSVWELSVQASGIAAKADGDYDKRTGTPDGSPISEAVYVEAMLRPWTDRRDWAKGKCGQNRWKNVFGYGVDDIEEWLETAPVTHSWVSEMLGLAPHGYHAAERWWRGWAGETSPVLPAGVVLAGRTEPVQVLKGRLEGAPAITTIRGGTVDEVLAFVAAALDEWADAGDPQWRSRTAFVDQVASWRALAGRPGAPILVAATAEVAAEAALGAPHHIVIPVAAASATIDLPSIEPGGAAEALRNKGLGEAAVEQVARLARRSLLAMRRSLATNPELHTPAWASDPSRTLRGLLLAGRWNQDREADRIAVSDLVSDSYDALREDLAALSRASDPFITQIGPAWMLTAIQDAWIQLRETIRRDDLDRLEPVVRRVLLERDPALDLPPEDRWRAAVSGKNLAHSSDLRRGVALTLAALGAHGEVIETEHGGNGATWAARVVGELLRGANADPAGDMWNSLAGVLPLLAEAAPDAFLDKVRDASRGEAPVIAAMFIESGSPMTGGGLAYLQQLLWALEMLAWSPDYLGRVAQQLARLAEIDPGEARSSSPFDSLVTIFFLQRPETSVPAAGRREVIEGLRVRHPEIAWRLMLALLPSPFALHGSPRGAEFRDWKPQERTTVTVAEWLDGVQILVGHLVADAADDTRRWRQILETLPSLPEADRGRIRAALSARVEGGTLDHDGQEELWEDVRRLIAQHRARSDSDGFLPVGELDALQEIEQALAPSEPVDRHRWLFARQLPELGDLRRSDPAYEAALRTSRIDAVREIEESGFDAVRELAASAACPGIVGACLAEAVADKYRAELLVLISGQSADRALAQGWLTERFRQAGWIWLDALIAELLAPEQLALALLASRDYPKAWQVADEHGDLVGQVFWKNFSISGLGARFGHAGEAANRLAQVGRVAAALELANIYLANLGDGSVDLLIGLLGKFASGYRSDPEVGLVGQYEFESLFEYLDQHADPGRSNEVARLEWVFLGGLGFEPSARRLREALTTEPELFVQVMLFTWRASDAEPEDDGQDDSVRPEGEPLTEEESQRVLSGYALLTSINRVPGAGPDGRVDIDALRRWTGQVLDLAATSGRRRIAEILIGQMLAAAPEDDDGTWPCEAVRDLLEELQSERAEQSLAAKLYNSRGVTSRGLEDGGGQEQLLVDRYKARAETFSNRWPQTSAVLRRLAAMYETDAREQEIRAERFRQGQEG